MKPEDDRATRKTAGSGASATTGGTVTELLRATADGLGQLVVQHVKLAQLDLTASVRGIASRGAVLAVCGVMMVVGYALTMAAIALLLGDARAVGWPLLGIGAAHVLGSGISMLVVVRRLRRTTVMKGTAAAIGDSARSLLAGRPAPAALPSSSGDDPDRALEAAPLTQARTAAGRLEHARVG